MKKLHRFQGITHQNPDLWDNFDVKTCLMIILFLCSSMQVFAASFALKIDTADFNQMLEEKDDLATPLKESKEFLHWFKELNLTRAQEGLHKLEVPLSHKPTYSIDKPAKYNEETILEDYRLAIEATPDNYQSVELSDEEILNLYSKYRRVYTRAVRWKRRVKYLKNYEHYAYKDIRGFYFLSKMNDLEDKLRQYKSLEASEQKEFEKLLIGLCHNSEAKANCIKEFNKRKRRNKLFKYYNKYLPGAQRRYNRYFQITRPRSDMSFAGNSYFLPFRPYADQEVQSWIERVVPQYWNHQGSQVELEENSEAWAYMRFKKDVTPNVRSGNRLTMNSDTFDYSLRDAKTFAHEIGHVLGFPDCYVEFYDPEVKAMIFYSIDPYNIMCNSSLGSVKEIHFHELQKLDSIFMN